MRKRQQILKTFVDVSSLENVLSIIDNSLSANRNIIKSKYVCLFNVHMCMEAYYDKSFCKLLNDADLVLADGFPISVAQKLLGNSDSKQIRGIDLTLALCEYANKNNIKIGFLGSTNQTLLNLIKKIRNRFNEIDISYVHSPPFREQNKSEFSEMVSEINKSDIKILFVGLGCPKQEKWMSNLKKELNCYMFGVGAVFDFIGGNKKEAPKLLQKLGLEWLFRLLSEPKRLWKRYLKYNPLFIIFFILQLFKYYRNGTHE